MFSNRPNKARHQMYELNDFVMYMDHHGYYIVRPTKVVKPDIKASEKDFSLIIRVSNSKT